MPTPVNTVTQDADTHHCDVLIIGGGPAGSALGTLLARQGWQVTLLEKEHHPRFHIGESLLPHSMPLLKKLGVHDAVRETSILKLGADFPNDDGTYAIFDFRGSLRAQDDYAFQVERATFDKILFDNARASGVDAREGCKVTSVEFAADGTPVVQAGGQVFRPRYLVDASGRDTFLANKLGLKQKNDKHASAAVFSHFTGVKRREGRDAGNVTVYRHAHGWIWVIPLPNDITSIGAVSYPEHLKQRRGALEPFLMETLNSVPELKDRMTGAQRVKDVHVTGNYAYTCRQMHGPRWSLLGDAYSFVDPMFSSGVFLALKAAEEGAVMVNAILKTPERTPQLQAAFERRFNRGLDEFKWFIYRFTSPTMKYLFANRKNLLGVEQAVVSMLSGDVFDAHPVIWRLRVFRTIYAIASVGRARDAWHSWRTRRRQLKVEMRDETLQQG